jgi:dynein assembly factor 3, axonemal
MLSSFRCSIISGARFDTRRNAFDWDLNMKMSERGFKRLNVHEYVDWRETGLAFHLTRHDYTQPNRTLASAFVFQNADGVKQARRGYWGDIITGPFVAHGLTPVDDDDPQMQAKANDKYVKMATDVSEYNVLKLLGQIQERNCPIKITFLPLNSIGDLCSASTERYRSLQFDLIYLGCSLTHYLNEHKDNFSSSIMTNGCSLILELPIFILDLKQDQIEQLGKRYDEMAKIIGCVPQDHEQLGISFVKVFKYVRS